jgi:hypothetical protein
MPMYTRYSLVSLYGGWTFPSREVHVGFVVDEISAPQVFLLSLRFYFINCHSTNAPYSFARRGMENEPYTCRCSDRHLHAPQESTQVDAYSVCSLISSVSTDCYEACLRESAIRR